MPPKPSRSPLYFYASEYQQQYQRIHRRKLKINEAIAACYDDWKALSDEEKQVYKNQYERWRIEYRTNPTPSNVIDQKRDIPKVSRSDPNLHERVIPCEELKSHYDRFTSEQIFLATEYLPCDLSELLSMPIYIINFQIFCRIDEEDGGGFIPAEMSILHYTLLDGVINFEQKFIRSNSIPSGYMSSCLEHAKETHQIPLKDFPAATDNYRRIYQELKSFIRPPMTIQSIEQTDERARRRYTRVNQPCLFFPAFEYEQTSQLFDWLQEKGEGIKPTKDTRTVNLASLESLIIVLAELKKYHVSRDSIQRTFNNAAYSYLIPERCSYHQEIGVSHCSVTRCHAGAKLLSNYLNQLYPSVRSSSEEQTSDFPMYPTMNSKQASTIVRSTTASSLSDSITRKSEEEHSCCFFEQRKILTERRLTLLDALQTLDQQIEQLDIE